jgi:hypothetical protein
LTVFLLSFRLGAMAKRKTTIYVDEDLLRGAKILAARSGKKDYEVLEDALRSHLGVEVLDAVRSRSELTEDQALELAYEALDGTRPSRSA